MQDLVTNQKLAPDCSRGSSRKLFHVFYVEAFTYSTQISHMQKAFAEGPHVTAEALLQKSQESSPRKLVETAVLNLLSQSRKQKTQVAEALRKDCHRSI